MNTSLEVIVTVLIGLIGVPLVQVIKKKVQVEDRAAMWLTFAVAMLLAVIALAVTGGLTGVEFTPDGVWAALTTIFTVATMVYR